MVQYEPDYSPLAWERLKKQLPLPESRLKQLLGKYRSIFFAVPIAGILIIFYLITNPPPIDKNSATDPIASISENYLVSATPEEPTYSKKLTVIGQNNSIIGVKPDKKSIPSDITSGQITNSFPTTPDLSPSRIPKEYWH